MTYTLFFHNGRKEVINVPRIDVYLLERFKTKAAVTSQLFWQEGKPQLKYKNGVWLSEKKSR